MRHSLRRPVPAAPRPTLRTSPPSRQARRAPAPAASADPSGPSTSDPVTPAPPTLIGEDAAAFDLAAQSVRRWAFFGAELTAVMALLWVVRFRWW